MTHYHACNAKACAPTGLNLDDVRAAVVEELAAYLDTFPPESAKTCAQIIRRHLRANPKQVAVYGFSDGLPITDELIEKLADEAERGYDIDQLEIRPRGSKRDSENDNTG